MPDPTLGQYSQALDAAKVDEQTADPSVQGPSLVQIPLSEAQVTLWTGELDRAKKKIETVSAAWDRNMQAYAPDPSNENWGNEINPGVDFYQVEQKKAQLFYDTPEIVLTPEPDGDPALHPTIQRHQAALNRVLGPEKIDVRRLMDKVLFDILCPSGMGVTKIGYTAVTKPDPLTGQEVPVFEELFWERLSPRKARIPTTFHDTEFDKAPFLGWAFTMPKTAGLRTFKLPADFAVTTTKDDALLNQATANQDAGDEEQISGTWLEYKAALYDPSIVHPQHLRELVFIDGYPDPVVHRDSPDQTFNPDGSLTPDSRIGFATHIFTIRDLADSAYVPSDCTETRPLVNELARFRTQLVEHRDSTTALRFFDEGVVTPDVLAKVVRGPYGALIGLPSEKYEPNRPPVMEVTHPTYSRENMAGQETIERDLTKMNALSANQVGATEDTTRSATESSYVQQNASVRLSKERNRVLAGFVAGVRKLDALLQRYPPPNTTDKALGRYTYTIKPDSGQHVDAAAERKFALDRYNFFAKAPNVNQQYLLEETAPMLGLDPAKLFVKPQPPKPEPPKISFIVKGEDLSPLSPQYPNMLQALKESGMTLAETPLTPELIQNAALSQPMDAGHPGTPPKGDLVDKHTADESGQTQHLGGLARGSQVVQ